MSNKPTPSESTNQLIQMATMVAQGQVPPETYQAVLAQRLEQSAQNRGMMEEKAQAKGEEFLHQHGELLDRTLDLMEAYEGGLAHQAQFFETGDPQALLRGNDMLAEAISPLLQCIEEYNSAYLSFGPSPYPLMNTVLNLLHGIIEKSAPPQALEEVKKSAVIYHEKAVEEIDQSSVKDREGYQSKRKAFLDIIRAMKELEPAQRIDQIEKSVRPLQLALEAMTASDEKIFAENTALKPTNMPSANVLINTVKGYLDGHFQLEDVREALHWYRAFTEEIEDQFDLAMEGETNSLVILEELPKTREIIDLHDEVLERLESSLEAAEAEVVNPILEELGDIVDRLEASAEVFLEAAQREGKLVCVKCGHANPPVNRTCESCNFKLPQMVDPTMFTQSTFELEERSGLEAEVDDDYHMGVNTYRLFEACYNFYEGHIDEETFQNEIDTSRATVIASEEGLSQLTAREITEKQEEMMTPEQLQTFRDSQEMFHETKQLLEEGIDDWHEGLDYFEQYIETRHRPTLETGIQLVFVASQKIHKVHKLGEMAEQTLAEIEDEERAGGAPEQAVPETEAPTENSSFPSIQESYDGGETTV